MGFGGSLIWTAVAREVQREFPGRQLVFKDSIPTPVEKLPLPWLSNKLLRRCNEKFFWPRERRDIIFDNNPRILAGGKYRTKMAHTTVVDRALPENSYAAYVDDEKVKFRPGQAVATLCQNFGVTAKDLQPELYFSAAEKKRAMELAHPLGNFVAIEPHAKDSFTVNKAWFFGAWQKVVNLLKGKVQLVQVGEAGARLLKNVVDRRGVGSFRDAAAFIAHARLFVGTVGGLMHAARASQIPGVILYSCFEPVELTAYPENINIYHTEVNCGPQGLRKQFCARRCMLAIAPEEIAGYIRDRLKI